MDFFVDYLYDIVDELFLLYHFGSERSSGIDIAVFSVTMSTLVEIHIIKIYGVIRNLIKILSSQVEQRLLQQLGTTNPVFSWGEGMSPNHDTSYIVIVIRILHELSNTVGSGHNPFEYDFVRQLASAIDDFAQYGGCGEFTIRIEHTDKTFGND